MCACIGCVNGSSTSTNGNSSSSSQQGYSAVGQGWRARWFKQQQGVTRYNCADSLDRTNVGSFFGAVQVSMLGCRLGRSITVGVLLLGAI